MKKRCVIFIIISLMISGLAHADVACTGTLKGLRLWGNGSSWAAVSLNEYPGTWIICDTDNTYGGVSPKSCNAMYSTALTALAASKRITLHFSQYTACSEIPSWDVGLPGKMNMLYIDN